MTITEEMVLAGAKAAARENGDDFDLIPKDKPDWLDKRGQFQGRYRDLNEPKQNDYIEMSRAALTAALADCVVVPTGLKTDPELLTLIERAKNHVMTPAEIYEQRRSFTRGMCPSNRDYKDWCDSVDRLMPPLPAPPAP